MQIRELGILMAEHPEVKAIQQMLTNHRGHSCHLALTGLYASARSLILNAIETSTLLVILDNQDDAQYMYSDLLTLGANVLYFPAARRRRQGVDEAMVIQRTEVLASLSPSGHPLPTDGKGEKYSNSQGLIIVSYPEALAEKVPVQKRLAADTIRVKVGETHTISSLTEKMVKLGFARVDFVYEPGQFAVRGGIVDVYSYSHEAPYRLDFFGDEIDSIREFEIETQLSQKKVSSIDIIGQSTSNCEQGSNSEDVYLTTYLEEDAVWVSNDWGLVRFKMDSLCVEGIMEQQAEVRTIEILSGAKKPNGGDAVIAFQTLPQTVFHKNFDLLMDELREKIAQEYTIYILSDQKKQTDRLAAIFEASPDGGIRFTAVDHTLHAGFTDEKLKIACYTDHEIFERYHRVTIQSEDARRGKAILTLKEINQLGIGDYVVHSDHGIGKFGGLVTTAVNGKPQEMIKLIFRDGDSIFVSIHNLHRISKYKGREGSEPTISKLGSGAWERLKERTKDKVKDIARDLIQLYAKRKQQKGFSYTPDGYMQHELEASFLYEDTPDQAKATLDIKHDMESSNPMDRLICGDVGFGKTELAMRAAFKAATDGKQVAVLVPTTVLALQHYNTFRERFKDFPVKVEMLSRAKTAAQTKEILLALKEGKIDILVGTHKLVGKSVVWKDLGLLIIDEEQKFGVTVKDKLKSLRANVDVLTLTATPIPRTLQFSLLGARDLSIMTTPPPNRYPVQTEVITMEDEDIIKEAIDIEIGRNGQVFVVNNRIEMLPRIENKLHRLCPEARIVVAHGQMPPEELEKRLEDFINYDYDILLATTIIESGIDIPNVNTMIIYSAQHYGLSDLHQLRGRVGRSNRKAYCYLVAPEKELLTPDARRRLDAISTFADLGSGFNLAMQDLDIRGAGNMLGAEQSGFIADLGYETYQRILNEAIEELKEENSLYPAPEGRPSSLDGEGNIAQHLQNRKWCQDSQLESDLPLCFPATYIENISERITLYRELDSLTNEDELLNYKKRLIDRFGQLPEEAEELLNVVRLRWLCCDLGIEKVFLKQEKLVLYFVTTNERYWQSDIFGKILSYICSKPERCMLVEDKDRKTGKPTGKRYATISQVRTLGGAINLLSKIQAPIPS